MTSRLLDKDTICDLQGKALQPDAVTVLKALDRLLTVGAYYASDHDQYLQAARQARDAIVGVIRAGRPVVAIEITAQGLMIDKQNINPNHRNVRLLHDLLVPLNIARFEIDAGLSPEDLRQAVAVLQEHRVALGQVSTFQEIVIGGLPSSVRALSRSVLHHGPGGDDGAAAGEPGSLDDLLSPWQDAADPAAGDWAESEATGESTAEPESERLARQFMEMVSEILENLQNLDREAGTDLAGADGTTALSREDLEQLRRALHRLVEVNPDPADLLQLITQARRALDLSQDRRATDLVFRILKRDLVGRTTSRDKDRKRTEQAEQYRLTVDELLDEVAGVETCAPPVAAAVPGAQADQLGIVLHLLGSAPTESLRHSLLELIDRAIARPDFDERGAHMCAGAVVSSLGDVATGVSEANDDLTAVVTARLRHSRPDLLLPFWAQVQAEASATQAAALWPHLVNDILLGFGRAPRAAVARLVTDAGRLPLPEALGQGRRLERLPALQQTRASRDLFAAPLTDTLCVHAMLMMSPLKAWLGQELHDVLVRDPLSPLVEVVMAALGRHHAEYTPFYLDLVRHHGAEVLPPEVADMAAAILNGALTTLPRRDREAGWVARGLTELGHLQPDLARPLLEQVVGEKRFLVFPAWPAAARGAATRSLAAMPDKGV